MKDARVCGICELLLEREGFISAGSLAESLGASESTLQRLLPRLERYIGAFNLSLKGVRGKGYLLEGSDEAKDALRADLASSQPLPSLSVEEKRFALFLDLLEAETTTKLMSLGQGLGLSESSVSKQLSLLEEELSLEGLHVERRSGVGTRVTGEETVLRRYALERCFEPVDETESARRIGAASRENPPRQESATMAGLVLDFATSAIEARALLEASESIELHFGQRFADQGFMALYFYLGLASLRISRGFFVAAPSCPEPSPDEAFYRGLLEGVTKTTEGRKDVTEQVLLNESAVFALVVKAAERAEGPGEEGFSSVSASLVEACERSLGYIVHERKSLISFLGRRIWAVREYEAGRSFFLVNDRLPFSTATNRDAALRGLVASILEERFGMRFGKKSVEHLALTMLPFLEQRTPPIRTAVVCASGYGVSYLLVEALKANFPELEIVDILPFRSLNENPAKRLGLDLIVSAFKLEGDYEARTVCVGLPLTRADIDSLRSVIASLRIERGETEESVKDRELSRYLLEEGAIRIAEGFEDWREAVAASVGILVEKGAVEPRYLDAVIETSLKYGPYYVVAPGLAMPHARPEDGAKSRGFGLVISRKPVRFGNGANDPVSLILAIAAASSRELNESAIAQVMDLIACEETVSSLKAATTVAEAQEALRRHLKGGSR